MTLAEGKYHQVKRMVAAISNRVEGLKRIQIGALKLPDDLEVGEWRWLSADDLEKLSAHPNNLAWVIQFNTKIRHAKMRL